ncbi:VIT domain-containing protein [Sorangium sp. So ce1000]|uniref:VIT domain-containing protein n=1 Tax=Sorangium sp. So ce1000 TaxID=3133325 RepID=UPI003F5DC7AE
MSSHEQVEPADTPAEEGAARVGAELSRRRRGLRLRLAVGALALAASVTALVLTHETKPEKTSAIGARLELSSGEVTLTASPQDDRKSTVVSGIPVPVGAKLATGKGARALVRLADGSAVFLRADSEIALRAEGLSVAQGEVWLDAPPEGRVGLSHALGDVNVSAADAGLSMRRSGDAVSVYVARGLAVVAAPGGRVEVHAGEQATVAGSAAPKVAPLAYWEDWTGGMGDHRPLAGEGSGSGRIYGVDLQGAPGTQARTLEISRQAVRAVLRDGIAETEVDQTFSNPGGRQVEGWYWFTVPERAIVSSFAVETNGVLVEGEVIERKEAAQRYQTAVQTGHEPALLEWVDGHSYRARIFPVPASGSRRVVLRYVEMLSAPAGKLAYVYPMRASEPVQIGEFSLSVDLGQAGQGMQIATLADAVIEDGGRRVSMRRSGYEPRADFQLEASVKAKPSALRVSRFAAGQDRADYVMARYVPDVDWTELKELPADLVVVVDTSASADEAARQQKAAAAEAILRAMSPSDHFALIALDSAPAVLHPKEGLAEASDKEISAALTRLAEHATGGATDLGALFESSLGRVHGKEQPAVIYIGDGLATSGEVTGARLSERLRRSLTASRARFFTVGVGENANHALLRELARAGGGQAFRIDEAEGSTSEVLRLAGAIKTPTITDLSIDLGAGLDEPMLTASGKVSRGEEVVLLARTHHALPTKAIVKGRLAGKEYTREHPIELDRGVGAALVPRFWAAEKMRRLLADGDDIEAHRGKVVELGLDYGLITPFTSTLALESEQAYLNQGIRRRRSPLRGERLTALTPQRERELAALLAPPSAAVAAGCARSDEPRAGYEESAAKEGGYGARAQAAAAPAMAPMVAEQGNERDQSAKGDVASPGAAQPPSPPAPTATEAPAAENAEAEEVAAEQKQEVVATRPAAPRPMAAPMSASAAGEPITGRAAGALGLKLGTSGGGGAFAPSDAIPRLEKARRAAPPVARSAPRTSPPPRRPPVAMAPCSDTARRPLAERIVVWSKRLARATTAEQLIARYEGALTTCELPDWRSRAALLSLLQAKVSTEGGAEALLARFGGEPEAQRFIAHALLRRSVDPAISAAVRRTLFGGADPRASWALIDERLAALPSVDDRLAAVRQALTERPDDPEGEIRRVRLLAEAGRKDEALAYGRRLRDRGFMSPALALELGDVLASSGFEEDALRTYSEVVEFDPTSPASRAMLGDVCLRHGWYAAAYRQYTTLTELAPAEPQGWLRLAAAAAGGGRVDEALRIQRKVAAAEGTPGADDPRAWARLLSAARIGRLLAGGDGAVPAAGAEAESLVRKLKELQLFSGPGALRVLLWEDYAAELALAARDGQVDAALGDGTFAPAVGLAAVQLPAAELARLEWRVRFRSDPPARDVRFVVTTIVWDGASFRVTSTPGSIGAKDREVALASGALP